MTPQAMAKDECANWVAGECLGVMITDDLAQYRVDKSRCTVGKERCAYFEACVLPMIKRCQFQKKKASWQDARMMYLAMLQKLPQDGREGA